MALRVQASGRAQAVHHQCRDIIHKTLPSVHGDGRWRELRDSQFRFNRLRNPRFLDSSCALCIQVRSSLHTLHTPPHCCDRTSQMSIGSFGSSFVMRCGLIGSRFDCCSMPFHSSCSSYYYIYSLVLHRILPAHNHTWTHIRRQHTRAMLPPTPNSFIPFVEAPEHRSPGRWKSKYKK